MVGLPKERSTGDEPTTAEKMSGDLATLSTSFQRVTNHRLTAGTKATGALRLSSA
ncbi:hypothetical protein X734_12835 [Mesorhizobium sp. L2C084A000]|nr:hypothetical protein X734_12835 [Mesorhizobium sp. L2C084A000]